MIGLIVAGLSSPVHAEISFGYHGGHHGYGFHIGSHGGHHGHRGYHGRHGYRHGYPGFHYRRYSGYRHHGYRDRYHDYHGRRSHPYRDDTAVDAAEPYPVPDDAIGHDASSHGDQHGWGLLNEGEPLEALSAFGAEAKANPGAGVPKAGYALAAASAGDLDRGVWAMRRAFRYEPGVLPDLAEETGVHDTVDELIPQYEYELGHDEAQSDAAFMIAALNVLKGDEAAADSAAARAAEEGDTTESLTNLQRVLSSGPATTSPGSPPSGKGVRRDGQGY